MPKNSEETERTAVYVTGDSGIFFPAFVTISSIRRKNPSSQIDYFMSFSLSDLTPLMSKLLLREEIQFIPSEWLESRSSIQDFPIMTEGAWPVDVMYNWVMPLYLWDLGYRKAVKVDYDMLCVAPWDARELLDANATMSALYWTRNVFQEGVTKETIQTIKWNPKNESGDIDYYNVGFVPIDIKRYIRSGFLETFREIYVALGEQSSPVRAFEQVAFSIAAEKLNITVSRLPGQYNHRVTTIPKLDHDHRPKIKNIHYVSKNKPWKPLSLTYIDSYAKDVRAGLYLYRGIWQRYAHNIGEYSYFVKEEPLDELGEIGIGIEIVRAMYRASH